MSGVVPQELQDARDRLRARTEVMVNHFAREKGIHVTCRWDGPTTPGEAPAWFQPDRALVSVDMQAALEGKSPKGLNPLTSTGRRRAPVLVGLCAHEAAHVRFTRWPLTAGGWAVAGVRSEVMDVMVLLEEPRAEHRQVTTFPALRPYLRLNMAVLGMQAVLDAVERDSMSRWEAARVALLMVGRVDAGVLAASDVAAVEPYLREVLGEDYDTLRGLWGEAVALEDGDVAGLARVAARWLRVMGEPMPDEVREQGCGVGVPEVKDRQEPTTPLGDGEEGGGTAGREAGEGADDGESDGDGEPRDEEGGDGDSSRGEASTGGGGDDGEPSDDEFADDGTDGGAGGPGQEEDGGRDSDAEGEAADGGQGGSDGQPGDDSDEDDENGGGGGGGQDDGDAEDGAGAEGAGEREQDSDDAAQDGDDEEDGAGGGRGADDGADDVDDADPTGGPSNDGPPTTPEDPAGDDRTSSLGSDPSLTDTTTPGDATKKGEGTQETAQTTTPTNSTPPPRVEDMVAALRTTLKKTQADVRESATTEVKRQESAPPARGKSGQSKERERAARQRRHEKFTQMASTEEARKFFDVAPELNKRLNTRMPTPQERALAKQTAAALRKFVTVDRDMRVLRSETPPGRLIGREAMQGSAQRAMGMMSTARPFRTKRYRHVEDPPLAVGFIGDASPSMTWAVKVLGTTAWVFANAMRYINGASACVAFRGTVVPLTTPGMLPERIVELRTGTGGHNFAQAFEMIDGALNLTSGKGVRVLVVFSDGEFDSSQVAAAQDAVDRVVRGGGFALWLCHDVDKHRVPPGALAMSLTGESGGGRVAGGVPVGAEQVPALVMEAVRQGRRTNG